MLLLSAQAFIVVADRSLGRLYGADRHWFVGTYTEPWRTVALSAVILLSLFASTSGVFARRSMSAARQCAIAAALIAGLAACLELTTAVHFNDALGELYVHTLAYRRARVAFPKAEDGWCIRGDFGSFVWRLNGASIHPRLLPLPHDASPVVGRLSTLSRRCEGLGP